MLGWNCVQTKRFNVYVFCALHFCLIISRTRINTISSHNGIFLIFDNTNKNKRQKRYLFALFNRLYIYWKVKVWNFPAAVLYCA